MSLILTGFLKVITGDYVECYKFFQSDFMIASPEDFDLSKYRFSIRINDCCGKFSSEMLSEFTSFDYLYSFVNSSIFDYIRDRYISPDCIEVYIY